VVMEVEVVVEEDGMVMEVVMVVVKKEVVVR
jgi:hypothetical protein